MKKIAIIFCVVLVAMSAVFAQATAEDAANYPSKDLTLIVPWNAGGSSDLIGRLLTADMAKTMGIKISVVNTPGATGTVGMNDCFIKPHDGYTLIANATPYNHGVLGLADWAPQDWDFMAAYYVPSIIAVPKSSPYKTFEALYAAMQDPSVDVTAATAGVGSSGFVAMEKLKSADAKMGNYKHIAYSGGSAAVTATLAGEVNFTPQLSNEMIDLLRSGDLIALAANTEEDLALSGVSYVIPSIKNFIPETEAVLPCGDAFGLLFPADIPEQAQTILEDAFKKACTTQSAKDFADQKGVILLQNMDVKKSNAIRDTEAASVGYILLDAGIAKKSPADFGYSRP